MIWKKLAQDTSLADLIDRLNIFLTDTDRLRKALLDPRSATSASQSLALNTGLQVDSTRVSGLVNGSTGSGSTETAAGNNTNVQFNTSGLLDGDDEFTWKSTPKILGVTGQIIVTGGVSAAGGFTLSTALTGTDATFVNLTASSLTVSTRATVQSLAVSTLLGVTGAVDFASTLGVTGLIMGTAGVSVTGGATLGSLGVASGATFGGTVRLNGGTMVVLSGLGIEPSATNVGSLGRSIRRWGNIFGATLNVSQAVVNTTVTANQITTTDFVQIGGTLSVLGGVEQTWSPAANDVYSIGDPNARWAGACLSGLLQTGKRADTIGATLNLAGHSSASNYYDVAGVTAVTGFSSLDTTFNRTVSPGTRVLLHLDSNPALLNSANLVLASGWTFYGSTDDHVEFVKDGDATDDVWRESGRQYGKLRVTERQLNPFPLQISWGNMATAESEFGTAGSGSTETRTVQDLSSYQYARVAVSMPLDASLLGAPGAFLYPQYSTDFSSWASLSAGGGSAPSVRLDIGGMTCGDWVPIAATARQEVWIRIMGVSGNGTSDPIPGNIRLELK